MKEYRFSSVNELGVKPPELNITKISSGLGFGEGSISADLLVKEVGEDVYHAGEAAIKSPQILHPLDYDDSGNQIHDDGCGDGRGVGKVFRGFAEKTKSLFRAKVFGGGAAMVASILIGLGERSDTMNGIFEKAIDTLNSFGIDFGAHSAANVSNPETNSGCGAIDKAPQIFAAAEKYQTEIGGVLNALGLSTTKLDSVVKGFKAFTETTSTKPYKGADVVKTIRRQNKIVKVLNGKHSEAWIVINKIPGYTVDQQFVRNATGGKLDVFAVDWWRLEQYAYTLVETSEEQEIALLSEAVYTLATAAILTKGDLAVYVIENDSTVL